MTQFSIKLIACITMLIDHMTAVFLPNASYLTEINFSVATDEMIRQSILYTVGRGVGRIAFPLFCFLIVEGLLHTRNLKKYFFRLTIMALLAEIPFNLMVSGTFFNVSMQNVGWTLLLGLTAIYVINYVAKKYPGDAVKYNLFSCLSIFVFGSAALLLGTDYSTYGVMLIVSFYLLRGRKLWMISMFLVLTWVFFSASWLQFFAVFAFLFLFQYNGKKGRDDRYILYAFYPVHMLILGLLVRFVL